jgi:hypothetical protein
MGKKEDDKRQFEKKISEIAQKKNNSKLKFLITNELSKLTDFK